MDPAIRQLEIYRVNSVYFALLAGLRPIQRHNTNYNYNHHHQHHEQPINSILQRQNATNNSIVGCYSSVSFDAMRCVAIATLQYHNKRATKTKQINYTNRNKYTKHKNKQQQQQQIKRQVMFQQKKINQMHNNSNLNKKKWLSKGREKK